MSEPLIVVGNGMAAARLVEELAKCALGRYAIAVIGEEPRLAYNRVLLSALLAEEVGFADMRHRNQLDRLAVVANVIPGLDRQTAGAQRDEAFAEMIHC